MGWNEVIAYIFKCADCDSMDKVKFYENLNELNTMDLINLNEKLEVFMIKSPIPVPLDRACICIFIKIYLWLIYTPD